GYVSGHLLERPVALLPVGEILRIADVVLASARAGLPNHDEPAGVAEGHGPEQHRIDDAEDGRVRTDPEHQREKRNSAETGTPPKNPNREADIFPETIHKRYPGASGLPTAI